MLKLFIKYNYKYCLQEVKLYSSNLERERLDTLADLYSIIVAVEHLEKAYIKSSISFEE